MNPKLTFSSDTKCCRIRDKLQLCALSYHTWHFVRGHSLDYNRTAAGIDGVDAHCVESRVQKSLWTRPALGDSFSTSYTLTPSDKSSNALTETVNSSRCKHTNSLLQSVLKVNWPKMRIFCRMCMLLFNVWWKQDRSSSKKHHSLYDQDSVIYAKSHLTFTNYNSRFQIIKFGWCYMLNTFVWVF